MLDADPEPHRSRGGSPAASPRTAWIALGDRALAHAMAAGLRGAGWDVAQVVHECNAVNRLIMAATVLPDLLVTGLRFADGDGLRLIRELGSLPDGPAVFVASHQQRAVIKAAHALIEACGLRYAGATEHPADVERIVALLAGFRPAVPPSRAHAARPELARGDLRAVIDRQGLFPWMQPKVRLDSLEVVGVEALMRGCDLDGSLVMPDRLIPALTAHGLLEEATLRMAGQAAEFVAQCLSEGMAISAAINVSMLSLARLDFCQALVETVERVSLDPSWITIEITETDAMSDVVSVIENAARIRMMGFNLAIDDFGTAYSSLTQLARIPFSELKIERAFVTHCLQDSGKQAVVSACAHLGRQLGLDVVAEGVETLEDLEAVRRGGCSHMQGYLVARPMPVAAALAWLRSLDYLRVPIGT